MSEKIPLTHQTVKETYLDLFSNKPIQNIKCDARGIIESILNFYLLKYEKINIVEKEGKGQNYLPVLKRVDFLIQNKRINKRHKAAFYYVYKEGNYGCHIESKEVNVAGEPTYIESQIICLRPIIRDFFIKEGLDASFLEINNNNSEIISKEPTIFKRENEHLKSKNKIFKIALSSASLILIALLFYMFSLHKEVESHKSVIVDIKTNEDILKKDIASKQHVIDTLKTSISTYKKLEQSKNEGIKNNFNGDVGKVSNINGSVDTVNF